MGELIVMLDKKVMNLQREYNECLLVIEKMESIEKGKPRFSLMLPSDHATLMMDTYLDSQEILWKARIQLTDIISRMNNMMKEYSALPEKPRTISIKTVEDEPQTLFQTFIPKPKKNLFSFRREEA